MENALYYTLSTIAQTPGMWTVLIVAVGLGLMCLGLYVMLIAAMVRRPTD